MHADLPPPAIQAAAEAPAADALAAATEARRRGDWREARVLLEKLVEEEPRNADAWLQLGYACAAGDDAYAARAAFTRALEIAPSYDDAKLGLAQLAYRQGDLPEARLWVGRISSERWNDPEVAELRRRLSPAPAVRVGATVAHSELTQGLEDWNEAELWVSLRDGRRSVGASIQAAERFGRSDVYTELRLGGANERTAWGVALGVTPDADFRPRAALRLELSTTETARLRLGGALSLSRYPAGEVVKADMRVGRSFGALDLTALGVVVRDETGEVRTGYGVGVSAPISGRFRIGGAWSDAPESSEGVTLDVRTAALTLRANLGAGVDMTLGALHEDRGAYERNEVSLAISRAF